MAECSGSGWLQRGPRPKRGAAERDFRGRVRCREICNLRMVRALKMSVGPSSPETDPDVMLMLAVQRGDEAAFARLFEKHVGAVVGYAAQFVGSRARAEELAQDVFLQIYKRRAEYAPTARFRTWLYRMVSNACVSDRRRAAHRRGEISLDQPLSADGEGRPLELPSRSSEDEAAGRRALARLRAVIEDLPPQQRAALLLARGEGFSYEEVAEALSCSVSAVKSLVHRATLTLRDRLGREGES